jgi:hypothetical protein
MKCFLVGVLAGCAVGLRAGLRLPVRSEGQRVFEGWKEAFLVDVEDALACQVSNALGVLALQRREADHIKGLEYVQ